MDRERKIKAVEKIISKGYRTNIGLATAIVDSMEIDIDKVFSLVEEVCKNSTIFDYPVEIIKSLTIANIIKIKE